MNKPEPLNLLNLAKAEPGHAKSALTDGLSVLALTEPLTLSPVKLWLVVLGGELIIDLPHGDFRVLKVGDSVQLGDEQSGEEVTLTPLQEAVFLFSGELT